MNDRIATRGAAANWLGRLFPSVGGALVLVAVVGCVVSAYPIVDYEAGGRSFRCEGTFGFNPARFRVGERVGVLSRAGQPRAAVIDTFSQRWGGYTIFIAVGLFLVLVSRGMASPEDAGAAKPLGPRCPGEPDYREEVGARAYAFANLGCLGAGFAAFSAVAGLLPVILGAPQLWAWIVAAACGVGFAFVAVTQMPLLICGGTYRVTLRDDRLRVESPHRNLGVSFDVSLTAVLRLVVWGESDGPNHYEVHTRSGDVFELGRPCRAARLFEAIRQRRPEIPVESRDGYTEPPAPAER